MGEAADNWEGMKNRLAAMQATQEERQEIARNMTKAMYDIANDLTYPADEEGNQMHLHWLIPLLSLHLAKCGYRKHEGEAMIKQIPHPNAGGPGIAEDAVLYVPVDATGTLPPAFTAPPEVEMPEMPKVWKVKTHVTVDGETVKGGTS